VIQIKWLSISIKRGKPFILYWRGMFQ